MPRVTLSEAGVALILLEQELRNNEEEYFRWKRRVENAEVEMRRAQMRQNITKQRIALIKESLR